MFKKKKNPKERNASEYYKLLMKIFKFLMPFYYTVWKFILVMWREKITINVIY